MKEITAVFIGRSGCGKGTQVALLKKYLENHTDVLPIVDLDMGVLFREFIQSDVYSQKLSREINQAGGLQPEFLTVNLWSNFFVKHMKESAHLIIDGSPRKFLEAQVLDSAFKFYKREKPFILYLDVSREEVTRRLLKRGRADDTEKSIKNRLDWFETNVMKAVEFYRNNPEYHFCDINGDQTIEVVSNDILKAIE